MRLALVNNIIVCVDFRRLAGPMSRRTRVDSVISSLVWNGFLDARSAVGTTLAWRVGSTPTTRLPVDAGARATVSVKSAGSFALVVVDVWDFLPVPKRCVQLLPKCRAE